MTESQENQESAADPNPRRKDQDRPSGVYRALAWVGIVAGSLFIVATVFFSGYVLGKHSDGGGPRGCPGHHRMLVKPSDPGMRPEKPAQQGQQGQGPRSARLAPPTATVAPPSP